MANGAFTACRAEHRLALPLAEQLEQIGKTRNDVATILMGRHAHGQTRLNLGDLVAARAVLERRVSRAEQTRSFVSFDTYAAVLADLALTLTFLGYIDQARSRMDEAISRVRGRSHAFTLAHVLLFAISVDRLTRACDLYLEEFQFLTNEHRFPHYSSWALAHRGRLLIGVGQINDGLVLVKKALAEFRAAGSITGMPMLLMWLAQAYSALGETAEVMNCVTEAVRHIEATDERLYEAELHRVQGDLLKARWIDRVPSSIIVRPLTSPSGKAQNYFNCGHQSASPGSGATRANARKRLIY